MRRGYKETVKLRHLQLTLKCRNSSIATYVYVASVVIVSDGNKTGGAVCAWAGLSVTSMSLVLEKLCLCNHYSWCPLRQSHTDYCDLHTQHDWLSCRERLPMIVGIVN
ncbi:hypothetical protein BaRGS_00039252 [Batillaria attramentaria]|uniref:Uncharacterized protein n=1 Tax=Batillaria attramentaria TaxID=370345 RepID=A0ABD0J3T5_9CAEN